MSVTWSLTREQIATRALQKMSALSVGQTVSGADAELCYQALDSILKELPWFGYTWPKQVSGQATITLTAATQTVTLPTDYYGQAMASYLDASGNEVPIELVDLKIWNAISSKSQSAAYPTMGYIDNYNVLRVWPVQTSTLTGKLVYQKVIDDTAAATPVNLSSSWTLGLIYGVCAEVGDEFMIPEKTILRWELKWESRRKLGIMNETQPIPDRVSVDD